MPTFASRSGRRLVLYASLAGTLAVVLLWNGGAYTSYAPSYAGVRDWGLGQAGSRLEMNERLGLLMVPRLKSINVEESADMGSGEATMSQHPLDILIAQGKQRAAEIEVKAASIQSLEDAVRDYEHAFGMRPPRGFDKWYEFASSKSSVTAPSLLSQAHTSVRPYLSIPPALLHERVLKEAENPDWAFYLHLWDPAKGPGDEEWVSPVEGGSTGNVSHPKHPVAKARAWAPRAVRKLLLPVAHVVPPPLAGDLDMVVIFSIEDQPRKQMDGDTYAKCKAMADAGEMWEPEALRHQEQIGHHDGWKWTCPAGTPFRSESRIDPAGDNVKNYPARADQADRSGVKSFIYDTLQSYDFCENLVLSGTHSLLIQDQRPTHAMLPVVTNTRTTTTPDLAWTPTLMCDVTVEPIAWTEKNNSRLLWRGQANGTPHNKQFGWRAAQRHRAHQLGHNATGTREVLVTRPNDHWTSYSPLASKSKVVQETWDVKALVKQYLDLWMVGQPYFCKEEDGSCDDMRNEINYGPRLSPDEAKLYKYILDIDGHGWSSRFRRELTTGSVLLKSTIVVEWHADILIPWYHYVPLKVDYGDIFDIMAYFTGSPDGALPGRDDLAEEIAANGRQFALQRWREEDMQSFTLLMLLEYQRMWSFDRDASSYSSKESMELDS